MNKLVLSLLFTLFLVNLQAQSYTLTNDDVTVVDGVITECTYDFSITDIVIPDELDGQTVIEVGNNVFSNKGIASITLPSNLENIGSYAFFSNNLTAIEFPQAIKNIEFGAFDNNQLIDVSFEKPSNITNIGSVAFQRNTNLTSITLPSNLNSLFECYMLYDGTQIYAGGELTVFDQSIRLKLPYTLTDDDVTVTDGVITECTYNFEYKDIVIPDNLDGQLITEIGDEVFQDKGIISIGLPSSLIKIGAKAFNECNIKSLKLPPNLVEIESNAFYKNNIQQIDFSENNVIEHIQSFAFSNNYIKEIQLPASIKTLGQNAFYANSLTSVVFDEPSNLRSIGAGVFSGSFSYFLPSHAHSNFETYLSNSDTPIAEGSEVTDLTLKIRAKIPYVLTDDDVVVTEGIISSCNYSSEHEDIIIPDQLDNQSVIGIAEGVFKDKGITTIKLPSTLKQIDKNALANNILTSIIIPASVETIGERAFYSNQITNIEFETESNIEYIEDLAFGANDITAIQFPATIKTIGNNAFWSNALTNVVFDEGSNLRKIETGAFSSNTDLTSITMPSNSNSSFEYYLLSNNTQLMPGDDFANLDLNVIARIPYTLTDEDVVVIDGTITECNYNFEYTDIVIPNTLDGQTVTEIGDDVFMEKGLTLVELPETLIQVGTSSFYNNTDMDLSIASNSALETIDANAFNYCNIQNLELPASVKTIGSSAFSRNYNMDLTISTSSVLENIGYDSFSECSISTLTIPASIKNIDSYAFRYNSLTSVTFEDNSYLRSIGSDAFSNNSELSSYTLPTHYYSEFEYYYDTDGQMNPGDEISDYSKNISAWIPYTLTDDDVTVVEGVITECSYNFEFKEIIIPASLDDQQVKGIGSDVFSQKGLNYVSLPEGIESIGSSVFKGNSLTNISLPSTVKNIDARAFYNNTSLDLTVSENSVLENIGAYAFYNCSISNLTVPATVNKIGASAFYSNNDMTLSFETNSVLEIIDASAFEACAITNIIIPSSVKKIYSNAFKSNALTNVTFAPDSYIEIIYNDVFSDNSELTGFTLPTNANSSFQYYSVASSELSAGDVVTDFSEEISAYLIYTLKDDDVVVTDGVITECTYSFDIKNINIPSSLDGQAVIGIGDNLFSQKGIEYISLPEGLDSIGSNTFYYNNIENLILPSTLSYIGSSAFGYNNNMNLTIPDNSILENISYGAFKNCAIINITIPSSVQNIDDYAFYSNNLNSVIFEANSKIRSIGTDAFSDNNDLSEYTLPTHGDANFQYYYTYKTQLSTGEIITDFNTKVYSFVPYTLTNDDVTIEDGVITECTYDFSVKDIIIPNQLQEQEVKSIGSSVFKENELLRVELPSTLERIEDYAFESCNLVNITFPSELNYIGKYAFRKNNIQTLNIPSSVTYIGYYAFYLNNIYTLEIPSSVKEIRGSAFAQNDNLANVTFKAGSNIHYIGSNAFKNSNTDIELTLPSHTNENFEYYTDRNTIYYSGNTISNPETAIYAKIPYTLTEDDVEVEDGFITSCSYSFESRFITIPDELYSQEIKGIGTYAFYNKQIIEVTLPQKIETINDYAFGYNLLKKLSLPYNLKTIESQAFISNSITSVNIPQNIKYIGGNIFDNNSNIEINFLQPSRLLYVAENAFEGHEVELPTSIYSDFDGYEDNTGSKWQPDASIDSNKSYQTDAVYTLDDSDVIIENDTIKGFVPSYCHHKIKIPSSLQEQSVKAIADGGIFQQKNITSLQLPYTLEYVGDYTFYENKISFIEIPGAVKKIGEYAFCNSSTLNAVSFDIDSQIQQIGKYAFRGNDNLPIELPTDNTKEGFLGYKAQNSSDIFSTNSITDHGYTYITRASYTLTDDDIVVENGIIVSVSEDFSESDIIIPNQLDGQTIIGIGSSTFASKGIISLELPNTIEIIEESAFANNVLTSIHFPASIKKIETLAFNLGQNDISQLTFDDNSALEVIEVSAFSGNSKTITLPSSSNPLFIHYYYNEIKEPGVPFEFSNAYSITSVAYHKLTSEDIIVENGVITQYNSTYNNIIIPNNIDNQTIIGIGEGVFSNKSLDKVKLPDTIEEIQTDAFSYNLLKEVTIPNTIIKIDEQAFLANNLSNVNFENNSQLMIIGKDAFSQNDLQYISLPSNLNNDFISYRTLFSEEVIEPNTPCDKLGYLIYANIPYELSDEDVVVEEGAITEYFHNTLYKNIVIPNQLDNQDILYLNNSFQDLLLGHIELPNTLKKLDERFLSNSYVRSIIIPASVDTIESLAFSGNSFLKNVEFEANSNIDFIGTNAFYDDLISKVITLPIHNSNKFKHYQDSKENIFNEGAAINEFTVSYSAIYSPTQISFDGNNQSFGDVPSAINADYGSVLTVPNGVGFRKIKHQFAEWNTKIDGTGSSYKGGDEIKVGLDDLTLYAIWDEYVGIGDIYSPVKKVYPNPTSGIITIESESKLIGTYLTLFNTNGVVVKQVLITSTNTNTNISDLPPGIYVLMCNNKVVEKIILK